MNPAGLKANETIQSRLPSTSFASSWKQTLLLGLLLVAATVALYSREMCIRDSASDFQASNIQAAIESQVVSRTLRPNVGRHLSRDLGVRIEGDAERRRQAGRFLDRRIRCV